MASPLVQQQASGSVSADEPSSLIAAWRNPLTRAISPVGILSHAEGLYQFSYLRRARALEDFRPLIGFPDLDKRYESTRLFPLFRQRLMDSTRPDFGEYIRLLGLTPDAPPLTVLGRSGGSRLGDSLLLIRKPLVGSDRSTHAVFFVHGIRHTDGAAERLAALRPGEELLLAPEPSNPTNPLALLVTAADSTRLGWVPDLLVDYAHKVCEVTTPTIRVARVNGSEAPPNLRLLVELRGHLPAGYAPFSGPEWEICAD